MAGPLPGSLRHLPPSFQKPRTHRPAFPAQACRVCTRRPFSLQTPSRRPRAASARRRLRLCSAVSTAAMLVKVTSPTWTAYLFTLFIFSIVLDRVP